MAKLRVPKRGRVPLKIAAQALVIIRKEVKGCCIELEQLRRGMEVEREHASVTHLDAGQTARIAAAHLCERPDYYRRLKKYVEP